MNALIVDDDRFVVEALKEGLEWKKLGFENIFTAYNINQAKSVISSQKTDLLLCDIDMPHGSGLDLLVWLRDRCNDILVIFLTNYANFDYAQKALELKSFHYLLKPIEYDKLTGIIRDATMHLEKKSLQQNLQCEHFWNAYISEKISDHSESLEKYFLQVQLPFTTEDIFLPVLFSLFPYDLTKENEVISHFTHTNQEMDDVKAIFHTAFADILSPSDSFIEYNRTFPQFLAVFQLKTGEIPASLQMDCETFHTLILRQMNCPVHSYIGLPSRIFSFRHNFSRLKDMVLNCLSNKTYVFRLSDYQPTADYYPSLDAKVLEFYLESAQYDAFWEYCHQYLHKLSVNCCLNNHALTSFQVDISQLIYVFLKEKGILANKLFHGDSYRTLSFHARYSLCYMEIYLRYILTVIREYLNSSVSAKNLAKSITDYVNQHYTEDITRDCLTDVFFLDPDYASKLFKKETGVSFKNYIIQKRISAAKELLRNTDLPINTVAANVGYGNYSYFTRLFKKMTNMTPVEYRNDTNASG